MAVDVSRLGVESVALDDATRFGMRQVTVVWLDVRGARKRSDVEVALWRDTAEALRYYRRGRSRKKPPVVRTILAVLALLLAVFLIGNLAVSITVGVLAGLFAAGVWYQWRNPMEPEIVGVGSPTLVIEALSATPTYETFQNARDYLAATNKTPKEELRRMLEERKEENDD